MNTHRSARRRPHVIDPAKVAWIIVVCVALASIIVAEAPSFAQSSPVTTESVANGPEPSAAAVPECPGVRSLSSALASK